MEKSKNYLTPIRSQSMVDLVISRLTDAIISGELKPGDQIPVETELVQNLGIGRNTVREAIRILVSHGVLEIRRADGTYVCDGFSPKILDPMIYSVILQYQSASYQEILELRKMIENGIMLTLFRDGIGDTAWKKIDAAYQSLVRSLSVPEPDPESIAAADVDFHNSFSEATGNLSIQTVYDTIIRLTRGFRLKEVEEILAKVGPTPLIDIHTRLLQAVRGDSMEELYDAVNDSCFYWSKLSEKESV